MIDRREFLKKSGAIAVSLPLTYFAGSVLSACKETTRPKELFYEETAVSFPLLEIKGDYYDIGYAIGSNFKKQINGVFTERAGYIDRLKAFVKSHLEFYDGLLAATERYFPHLIRELHGIADGSGNLFSDIFIFNIKAEIGAAMTLENNDTPGCSTIYYLGDKEKFYVHNEDGNESNNGLMFMVKATPPSGVSFYVMTYPGILMGNGPAINSSGITQSTNYIASLEYKIGVPRYVLGRAVLESKTLDEAVKIATHPERAFAYHHNLGSMKNNRIISLEVTPSDYKIYTPEGIYCHTNHLILEDTKNCLQDSSYINSSSMSRYEVLIRDIEKVEGSKVFTREEALSMLSSHEQKPYSPCRHPEGSVNGRTLGTVLFDFNDKCMVVYKGNPCIATTSGLITEYRFPR